MQEPDVEEQPDLTPEIQLERIFVAPSIYPRQILSGVSYSHFSAIPSVITQDSSTECVLGVDEAGRGPVLGPMVYGVFYLPKTIEKSLLVDTHHFDDSKVLTPTVRSNLMQSLCTSDTALHTSCGWATRVMSARDISSGMLKPNGPYNLNAQAMDATVELIHGVFDLGVNVREIYIDTIGNPLTYQRRLEKIFPTVQITVAKKADSLYPCVSAASVCAKVTRDAALEASYEAYMPSSEVQSQASVGESGWGSGYPSDARCTTWLKRNMDPLFGWGSECRFSWGTAKEMLEPKKAQTRVDWPEEEDAEDSTKIGQYFTTTTDEEDARDDLAKFFGMPALEQIF